MTEDLELSIVIPVFDEEASLLPLHRELDAALSPLEGRFEILFVDDASSDLSADRLAEIAAKDTRVRVFTMNRRSGQSTALSIGFAASRGRFIATLDADLQNDPADLPGMLARLDEADVVCGVRVDRRDSPLRRFAGRVANAFRNAMTGESVSDVGCSLRVMNASMVRRVKMYRGMHRFLPTLLAMEGAKIIEVPVSHRPRRFGRSKYGILDRLWVGLVDVLAVRWMQSRRVDSGATESRRADPGGMERSGERGKRLTNTQRDH